MYVTAITKYFLLRLQGVRMWNSSSSKQKSAGLESPRGRALKALAKQRCPGGAVPPGRSTAELLTSHPPTTAETGFAGHAENFLATAQMLLMKGNFLMCKTSEILPGMPGHSAKPHKTHMKRTESQQAERWGKIIRNEESLGSTAASNRAYHHPTPAPFSLVFANEPEEL